VHRPSRYDLTIRGPFQGRRPRLRGKPFVCRLCRFRNKSDGLTPFLPFKNVAPTSEAAVPVAAEDKPATETAPAAATETPTVKKRRPFTDVFNFAAGKKTTKVGDELLSFISPPISLLSLPFFFVLLCYAADG
jgi:hypothetical protein